MTSTVEVEAEGAEIRTELAWSRSGLAVLTCVLLLARRWTALFHSEWLQIFGLALLVALGAIVGVFALVWRERQRVRHRRHLGLIAAGTTALGVIALGVALIPAN
jgi:cyanate permease